MLVSPPHQLHSTPLLRRVRVPRDLDAVTSVAHEDDPADAGLDARTVERIWESALDLYRSGGHPAVQICLRRNGHVVLNRAIGHARGNGTEPTPGQPRVPVSVDTPFCVYSASKAWTATVAALMVERGHFALQDRVTDYLPGYGKHGKGRTTIAHVLTHRAAIPYLPAANADLDRLHDHEFIRDTLCDLRPVGRPGTLLAYHALTSGYLIGEIIRTVTGRGIEDVLRTEILEPLGFRWSGYGVQPQDLDAVGHSAFAGFPILPPVSGHLQRALSGSLAASVESSNDPRFLSAVVPSANVVTTAQEMSRFFELLRRGGELDGVRVLQPETMRRALTQTAHLEPDLTLIFPVRYGYGYMLGARHLTVFGQRTEGAFGHLGLSNVIGWADPRRGLSGAIITSGKALVYPGLEKFIGLTNHIAARVPRVPRSELHF